MQTVYCCYQSLSDKTRVIFLTAPPVNEAQLLQFSGWYDYNWPKFVFFFFKFFFWFIDTQIYVSVTIVAKTNCAKNMQMLV